MKLIKLSSTLFTLLFTVLTFAQRPPRDKVKTLKVAFITEELELTSKEAQDFWPIYNAHEEQMEKLRRNEREQFGGKHINVTELSEKEAEQILESIQNLQSKKVEIDNAFIAKLKNVLPSKKIVQLIRAEEQFKRRLLQEFRRKRQ